MTQPGAKAGGSKLPTAETATATAHEPPPGLSAFDSDDEQDLDDDDDDLEEILGSMVSAEDSQLDELTAAPDDDDDLESVPLRVGCDISSGEDGAASRRTTLPRSSILLWLINSYRDLCETLRMEIKSNASHQPSVYDSGQFLLTPKNPMFAAARTSYLSPRLFYELHYFLWLPHLFNRIPCPACKEARRTNNNGTSIMLCLLGWPQAPRRAVDIDYTLYIVGYRYYCGQADCRKTYLSWSPAIMEVLPPAVAAQFQFHLTY